MIIQDTVPIVYNPGAYGTYLEYLLDTFTCQGSQRFHGLPFDANTGSSHQFIGHFVNSVTGWRNYIADQKFSKFVRLHPKTLKDESLSCNIHKILSSVNQAILIYPTESTLILNLNNYYYKVWDSWLQTQFDSNNISISVLYDNWPISKETKISEIPNWIIREFLSLYLVPAWYAQIEWPLSEQLSNPNLLIVRLSDLMHDIIATVEKICKFCNLDLIINHQQLSDIHQIMLSYQKNLHKDVLCRKIVQHVVDGIDFDYSNETLTLIDESWIQWRLRELGYELQCHELNQFPTSTAHLTNKIYQI
jgi:hypothetical protein